MRHATVAPLQNATQATQVDRIGSPQLVQWSRKNCTRVRVWVESVGPYRLSAAQAGYIAAGESPSQNVAVSAKEPLQRTSPDHRSTQVPRGTPSIYIATPYYSVSHDAMGMYCCPITIYSWYYGNEHV